MTHEQELEQSRRPSIDYDQRPTAVVNGGYQVEQNGRVEDREPGSRSLDPGSQPTDPGHVDRYRQSPKPPVIKQERHEHPPEIVKASVMNGVVAKHFNGTSYQEYSLQKVLSLSSPPSRVLFHLGTLGLVLNCRCRK